MTIDDYYYLVQKEFPKRLVSVLEFRRMNRTELAKRMHIPCNMISTWTTGRHVPSLASTMMIADALDCNLLYLLGYEDEKMER